MSKKTKKPQVEEDDEETGRKLFGWLERPGATFYVILALAAVAAGTLFFDAFRARSAGGLDSLWGFYALIGAGGLTAAVLAGIGLQALLGRPLNYYEADDDQS
ncbi:MAG: hypothetical protein ABWZ40_09825 [Caulobacterales bacterium]